MSVAPRKNELLDCLKYTANYRTEQDHPRVTERDQIVELYDDVRPALCGYLISLGLLPQEAEDVVQETVLSYVGFRRSGGRIHSARSWLFRVAHNLAVNLQKRERRTIAQSEEIDQKLVSEGANPEEASLRDERMRLLASVIKELTERQRQCLHLRAEGLRYREIGEVLGITTSTVAESLKRAVTRLMDVLYE